MTAPNGPVAPANVRGSEKMRAPTIPPTTIAVNCIRDIFSSDEDITGTSSVHCRNAYIGYIPLRVRLSVDLRI
jgi:hypothetical protein